jgi:hypothetical protein
VSASFLKKPVKKAIAAFDSIVGQTREIIRPGSNNERKTPEGALLYELQTIIA